jgi:diamine N-acetyltransferase
MEHTAEIAIRAVTDANWRGTLELSVWPEQQRFISDYSPIAALALAKAYIRPGGMAWAPYAIYAGGTMVGFFALAYEPDTTNHCWLFHFFIDQRYQGRGYGKAALQCLIELVRREHPRRRTLHLTVHAENIAAQRLYTAAGFQPTGTERWGEPVYQRAIGMDDEPEP